MTMIEIPAHGPDEVPEACSWIMTQSLNGNRDVIFYRGETPAPHLLRNATAWVYLDEIRLVPPKTRRERQVEAFIQAWYDQTGVKLGDAKHVVDEIIGVVESVT